MTEPIEPNIDPAGLRGPGDPEAAKERQQQADLGTAAARQQDKTDPHAAKGRQQPAPDVAEVHPAHPEAGQAGNIREEQMIHAAGTVPAAYVGSEDGGADGEGRPEDAVDAGTWDADV